MTSQHTKHLKGKTISHTNPLVFDCLFNAEKEKLKYEGNVIAHDYVVEKMGADGVRRFLGVIYYTEKVNVIFYDTGTKRKQINK